MRRAVVRKDGLSRIAYPRFFPLKWYSNYDQIFTPLFF